MTIRIEGQPFTVRCRCSCGCTVSRSFPRQLLGLPCYPCAVGVHATTRLPYPTEGDVTRAALTRSGHSSAGTSPDAIAAQEGSEP